jgi:hypothetical protein
VTLPGGNLMVYELGLTGIWGRPGTLRGDRSSGGQADALGALRLEWGHAYVIDVDSTGRWLALRKDGLPAVTGRGPGQLLAAITEDYAAKPVKVH